MSFFPVFALECTACDVVTELRFNDWPAYRFDAESGELTTTVQLNPMIIEGPNVLRVLMRKKSTPPVPQRRLVVSIFRMLSPDELQPLVYFRHRPELHPLADDGFTEVFRQEITFAKTFGRWKWEDAKPYLDADRDAVIAAVREAHTAVARGDMNAFVELASLKVEEMARAQGKSPAEQAELQRKLLGVFFGLEGIVVEPFDAEALELESWCQGRLVSVRGPGGKRPIRAICDGQRLELDAVLTRVGDSFRIAR